MKDTVDTFQTDENVCRGAMNGDEKRFSKVFPTVSAKEISLRASCRLSEPGARITMCIGVLMCILAAIMGYISTVTVLLAFDPQTAMSREPSTQIIIDVVAWSMGILFAIPLCEGYRGLAAEIARGGVPDLRLMFDPFSSAKKISRAFLAGICVILRVVIAVGVPIGAYVLTNILYSKFCDGKPPMWLDLIVIAVSALLSVTFVLRTCYTGLVAYMITVKQARFREAFRTSRSAVGNMLKRQRSLKLWVGSIPLILLSIATFCVLFVIHTIPLLALTFAYHSEDCVRGM